MICLKMFWAFFQVGLFSVGGGYAAIPLIQAQVVDINHWISMNEFTDLITIAEMTPGPIAVNCATFAGITVAGFWGALSATLGCIFPSCIIASVLAFIYYRFKNLGTLKSILASLRPCVVALIASAGLSILKLVSFGDNAPAFSSVNYAGIIIFAVALFVLRKYKKSPILVMGLCGVAYLIVSLL